MDEDNCMVDIAKFFLEFTVDESCGKCSPCRIGTKRMMEILEKITSGKGTLEDIDKLEELAYYIKQNSLCGLGQTAPNRCWQRSSSSAKNISRMWWIKSALPASAKHCSTTT